MIEKYYVYDIEILRNAFTIVFMNDKEQHIFVIHQDRNDFRNLVLFLQKLQREDYFMVGFNNWSFDYSFIDWILVNYKRYIKTWQEKAKVREILKSLNQVAFEATSDDYYPRHKTAIKQVDLYKIWHFDNPARRCSLKWLEFAMGMENVEDTPFDYNDSVTLEEIERVVLPYNINDVEATHQFMKISASEIKHRLVFGEKYNMYFLYHSHTAISKMIFAYYLCNEMRIDWWTLKKLKTERYRINLGSLIFPFIEFKTEMFQYLLKKFKGMTVSSTREINETVEYGGLHFDFGSGGLHSFPKYWEYKKNGDRKKDPVARPEMWITDDTYQIVLVDVSSYYPNIGMQHEIRPEHLGASFNVVSRDIYAKRLQAKYANPQTELDKIQEKGLKLSLNSVYGLSNHHNSFFYDMKYTLSITINGQLMLTMLAEDIHEAGFKLLQCNTDGIYVYTDRKRIDELREICDSWEKLTKMKLDFEYYKRLIQLNVNNYLAESETGYVKEKGSTFSADLDWHQDHSAKVVRKAIINELLYDIPYRDYINNHDNLDDFLLGVRLQRGDRIEERYIENGEYKYNTYYGVVRYAITNDYHLEKCYSSGNSQAVNKGWKGKVCNKKSNVKLEDINRTFYIKEAEKIVSQFKTDQLSLF